MPAPERGPVHELLERADAVAARYDATRVLADCPCSGCNATRVLADVEHVIRLRIRAHARLARYWKRVAPDRDDARRGLAMHRMAIRALLAVRRAARGGRDGGGE